ncbi:hypothetical protein OL548_33220 [Lysinibacillus sp. MHQ-1]|nr:hypothetical protein OL548_33220 [Lysinibacillus sp. MHQ-1]
MPKTGDFIEFDKDVTVKVLNANEHATDNNDASIVLKVVYGNVSFLLTGDAGIALEKEVMSNDVTATVLKAGHHGSNTSSSEDFIRAVKPEVTILSYGEDNKYGHPHAEVVNRLQAIGSNIYATADLGTITVATNGVNYTVNGKRAVTQKKPSTVEPTTAVEIVSKDLVTEIVGIKK